jgi:hypothetical protein
MAAEDETMADWLTRQEYCPTPGCRGWAGHDGNHLPATRPRRIAAIASATAVFFTLASGLLFVGTAAARDLPVAALAALGGLLIQTGVIAINEMRKH